MQCIPDQSAGVQGFLDVATAERVFFFLPPHAYCLKHSKALYDARWRFEAATLTRQETGLPGNLQEINRAFLNEIT